MATSPKSKAKNKKLSVADLKKIKGGAFGREVPSGFSNAGPGGIGREPRSIASSQPSGRSPSGRSPSGRRAV